MAERKMRYAVLTYFEKNQSVGNKAKYQWDADNLLESYPYSEIKLVIDYYFKVTREPSWTKLVYGFDDYRKAMYDRIIDDKLRAALRDRMKEWIK